LIDNEFVTINSVYIWDANPENSKLLGRRELNDFSSLLYSINQDKNLLLAIKDEIKFQNGTQIAAQISLLDGENVSNPILLHRITMEESNSRVSQSLTTWDFQNFRWLSFGDGIGILFFPMNVVSFNARAGSTGNFDGYKVFDVSRDGIFERFNVSHVESEKFYDCYHQAFLPERTIYWNGSLISVKGHSVVSMTLRNGMTKWNLSMPKPLINSKCMFWLF
jgi:hypothetical protein